VTDESAGPEEPAERDRRGIQSVEVGGQLLRALVHQGRPMALKDLAREAGMAPAKAHPYLVSFGKLGLIEQDPSSGRYGLGPLALQLGLISLQQADPVRVATPLLPELAQRIGHTVALGIWGTYGPTIVQVEEAPTAVRVNMRHGTVMSLTDTASGRLFAAFLPRAQVRAAFDEEQAREQRLASSPPRPRPRWVDFEATLEGVRRQGYGHTVDELVPGVSAMAAPVFKHSGDIVMSVTAIGPTALFDVHPEGALARALVACAGEVSQRLGALPSARSA
jgi:DNA-binding IclR family transcriptional regulator